MRRRCRQPRTSAACNILGRLGAQDGLFCLGPRAGKQPTFVLLDEWVHREAAR